jgi:intein/homing endonuclease
VNLLDYYKNSDEICVGDRNVMIEVKKQLTKKGFKFSRRIRDGLTYDTLSLREFHELCENNDLINLYYDIRNIKQKFSRNHIPSKLKLDKKLGRFVGYLMGDGHVKKNCLDLSNITPEIRKDFVKISDGLFGFQALVLEKSVRVHSKTLVSILSDVFGVKDSSKKKRITSTILTSNEEFISGFLSGLFDTDGHVSLKKTEIEFCSKSEELAFGVSMLLLKFGIHSTKKVKHNKKYNQDYYLVFIRGSKTLKIFLDNIPFISEMKKERLIHSTSLHSNTNIDVIPSVIAPLLEDVMKKLRISESETARRTYVSNNLSRYGIGTDSLSRNIFAKIIKTIENRAEELIKLCNMAESMQLPTSNLDALLSICKRIKARNNIQYKTVSGKCGVSAATVRRVLVGETAPTDSLLELGRGLAAASSQEEIEPLTDLLQEYEQFSTIKTNTLFDLADKMHLSYEVLDRYSNLYTNAWASYKRGRCIPDTKSRISMIEGLKKAVVQIRKCINDSSENLNLLRSLADSSILWDRVKEIKNTDSSDGYVYDLALKEHHNFFAVALPVVVHNSHLCSVMLEELLDRKKEDGRIAIVVIDIHGEYAGFAHDDNYGSKTAVVDGSEIFVPLKKVPPESIEEWLPHLSGPQRELLRHAMHELRREKKTDGYSMKELFAAIDEAEVSKEESKKTLKRSLSELRRFKFLSRKKENPKLLSTVAPGRMLVLDFSPIDSMRKKQILVALIARRLFRLRKKGRIPPFLLLIEEAHNFAREKAEAQNAISRSVIETIAREGRKFGASLCLISQRPVNLSTTALSQCNSHIILRVTNPNDLDHIQMSSEGIDRRVAKSITSLKVGEAIIVGEAVNFPTFVAIRERKSKKREKGAPLHQQAVEYEELKEKKEEQVEAFL